MTTKKIVSDCDCVGCGGVGRFLVVENDGSKRHVCFQHVPKTHDQGRPARAVFYHPSSKVIED